ncbi:MAG TPA: cysteine desulfurase [Planctomycetes bacterium]|nr:cysteine desulfurase [Planctomycetota bacterium]
MRQIYLDYNATTPIAPSVREAMQPFFVEHFGNPSSSHILGRACLESLEDARSQVASLLGADVDEIIFTSGGTESNNLAILGTLFRNAPILDGHLIISNLEHPAVTAPAEYAAKWGIDVTIVECGPDGVVSVESFAEALRPDTRLVSIMHANNELGTIQPIREIGELCRSRDIVFHTDAAQSAGKIPTNVDELQVDLLSIAGHKLYAPKGVGALYVRRDVAIDPVLHGAGHEMGLRPGTENVPYIVGLGRAAKLAHVGLDENAARMGQLRDRLWNKLHSGSDNAIVQNVAAVECLPNTLSARFPNVSAAEMLQRHSDLCASTASACHSGDIVVSPTLAAIGLDAEQARGVMRLSVGRYTTETEVDQAAELLLEAWESLRR